MDSIYILAEEMKILIDENIPYVEHFFHDYLDDIEYFKDKEFEINMVKEDSVVITRSTYKTHGKKKKYIKKQCKTENWWNISHCNKESRRINIYKNK